MHTWQVSWLDLYFHCDNCISRFIFPSGALLHNPQAICPHDPTSQAHGSRSNRF